MAFAPGILPTSSTMARFVESPTADSPSSDRATATIPDPFDRDISVFAHLKSVSPLFLVIGLMRSSQ